MLTIHCDACGGFMNDPSNISYRVPVATEPAPAPHSGLCACTVPIVYGPPPGFASMPNIPSVHRRFETNGHLTESTFDNGGADNWIQSQAGRGPSTE